MTSSAGHATTDDRVNVLGVGISPINLDSAREIIFGALERKEKGYVCVTNVHAVSEAQTDPEYKAILNQSFLTTPDGMPLVWIGRWQGRGPAIDRVYGPDLMMEVFAESEKTGHTHYFYGGKDGVAPLLKSKMEERFPKARIVGTYSPPFRPLSSEERATLLA
ncbi:MAG: WecB/TagA/CpsF family glycosyltransferase, partial [Verrucomicrobiota bacterium]